MPNVSTTETFKAPIETVYSVLSDFDSYPNFMTGVSSVDVLSTEGNKVRARYNINVIKKFEYTMDHILTAPNKIEWNFVEGDLFKTSTGSWELKSVDDSTTEVTYTLDMDFKVMVPGMMSKKLVSSNLPSMMKSIHREVEGRL